MNILIVSFVDDNFGDNLIRISFESLLKVVLNNLNIATENYQINKMHLKRIDKELVVNADVIFFAGGGLFGLSYLNFFEYLDEITRLAEERNIPVIFSSIGMNNMDATPENEELLKTILRRKCIKAISARENISLFKEYSTGCGFTIETVCDPAVWTQYVYNMRHEKSGVIGINVVRGGLFKDNKKNWGMTDELKYLHKLKSLLDESDLKYKFYTNGSFLDNNTLRFFAREYSIPLEQVVYPHTTKEVVETIAEFDAVVTFRMHSSIIAYSFQIPSVALVWNDKIPFFYQNINHPERAFDFDQWNSEIVFNQLLSTLEGENKEEEAQAYQAYLMTLYLFLYKTVAKQILKYETVDMNEVFGFEKIIGILQQSADCINEDVFDLRFKIEKGEKHYLARFTDLRKKESEISNYKKDIANIKSELANCRKQTAQLKEESAKQKKRIETQKAELDQLNQMFAVRAIKYVKRKTGRK